MIPVAPNTNNEPLMTVEQAVAFLTLPAPLSRGELSKLGRECSMVARVWKRPTGQVEVTGQNWSHVKSYTYDVLKEVFRLNPATKDYLPKENTNG